MLRHKRFQVLNPPKTACLGVSKSKDNGWRVNYNIIVDA
jgi:hypothetical protein